MNEVPAKPDLFGQFQTEHNLHRELFEGEIGEALEKAGYRADDISNRRALFADLEIVRLLEELPDDDPVKALLREARWGATYHRGGDTKNADGFQSQKNAFQRGLLRDWVRRSEVGYNGPDTPITKDAFRLGVAYLSKFSDDQANPAITRRVLTIMLASEY